MHHPADHTSSSASTVEVDSRPDRSEIASSAMQRGRRSPWKIISGNPATFVGFVLVLFALGLAVLGSAFTPYPPNQVNPAEKLSLPTGDHLLGTDQFGRDLLSRLMSGARISISVAVISIFVAVLIGVTFGSLAGFFDGWLDDVLMRIVDVMMSFPYIILAIALAAALGPGYINVVIILVVINTPIFARISRGTVLVATQSDYVLAARALGQTRIKILLRHVLPNSLTAIGVVASLSTARAITAEAAMSFLGLGIRPPQASWGNMLTDSQLYMLVAPWMGVAPGLMVSLTVLGFNLLGDGLRDVLDPRMRSGD